MRLLKWCGEWLDYVTDVDYYDDDGRLIADVIEEARQLADEEERKDG